MDPSEFDDEFSVSPEDVRRQAGPSHAYGGAAQDLRSMGMNPLSAAEASFSGRQFTPPTMPQKPSPMEAAMNRDAAFYAKDIGDTAAAMTLAGSKGRAVFQMFDPYEFKMGISEGRDQKPKTTTMRIVPKGEREIQTPTGVSKLKVWQYAQSRGVTTVPYKGGDEAADSFRSLIGDAQTLLEDLTELEKIYKRNMVLTGFGPSTDSAEARMLESKTLSGVGKFFSGARGLGGQVSDRDMKIIEGMSPQRASAWFSRLRGNELKAIERLRSLTISKLNSVAQANGLEFLPENKEDAAEMRQERYRSGSVNLR